MKTTRNWTEQGTRAVIDLPVPIAARLFGLPFLGFGLYLLRLLVTGAMHPADMTVAGWILLPVITLAFLAPGWALVFVRRRVVIDAASRTALDEMDFLLYSKRTPSALLSTAHVLVRDELGTPGDDDSDSVYWTHVYLVADTPVLIGMFADKERADADALAQRAATFLGVHLVESTRRARRGQRGWCRGRPARPGRRGVGIEETAWGTATTGDGRRPSPRTCSGPSAVMCGR